MPTKTAKPENPYGWLDRLERPPGAPARAAASTSSSIPTRVWRT